MKDLCKVEINKIFKVIKIEGDSFPIKRRLLELGFLCGRNVKVVRKSLIKKTVLVEIEGYLLSLRCSVAQMILVE